MRKFLITAALICTLGVGLAGVLKSCEMSGSDAGAANLLGADAASSADSASSATSAAGAADDSVILAAEDEELGYDPETDYLCAQAMLDQGYPLVLSYENFLNEYFKIDAPSSEQVEMAITAYRAVENSLRGIYSQNIDLENVKTFEAASQEDYYCTVLREEYIEFAQLLLQKQVVASANSKTTFKVIDGLKDINESLEDLTMDFLSTFPNVYEKMDNALPCYARQCITQ